MTGRDYINVTLTQKGERALRGGHPWVFADEITAVSGEYKNGDIVDVLSSKGKYLGSGFINDNSKIRVRVFSFNANDRFDEAFWKRRVEYAISYRETVMRPQDMNCCRIIFGESDSFPGLTVDKFGDILCAESMCLGTDMRKDIIYPLLCDALRSRGYKVSAIYERNDAALRDKEGLPRYNGFYKADGLLESADGNIEICENGIYYYVDYIQGQKTGFFLDQKFNRLAVSAIAKGKTVLDCFTHTGSFGINAAMGGAKKVTSVDISEDAVEMTRKNIQRNGFQEIMDAKQADVFELLTEMSQNGKSEYDFIILDPPAFTKSRATVKNAIRGYKDINYRAMKLLPRGGYLATCSCSHFMTDELFRSMLMSAAADAGVSLRQIEVRRQAPDHPILWTVPETEYLKFYIFQVV